MGNGKLLAGAVAAVALLAMPSSSGAANAWSGNWDTVYTGGRSTPGSGW